jgi:hypothetical protein
MMRCWGTRANELRTFNYEIRRRVSQAQDADGWTRHGEEGHTKYKGTLPSAQTTRKSANATNDDWFVPATTLLVVRV